MKDTERAVSYYDLFLESRIYGEKDLHRRPVPTRDGLRIARAQLDEPYSQGLSTIKVTLADWTYSAPRREHHIIVNRADASLQDIPLRHLETGATRMAGKAPREGIDLTCHILIRERTDPTKPALMLFTNGSSLSADKICKLLTSLFRMGKQDPGNAEHYVRAHPSGEEDKVSSLNTHFAVGAHQNATLRQLLNGGNLEGVELISEAVNNFDAASPLAITGMEYKLEPVRAGRVGLATIQRAIAALRGTGVDPSKARVRYRVAGRSKSESHTFDIEALENTFVRREVIRFNDPIAARYERVEPRIMSRLAALADRERIG